MKKTGRRFGVRPQPQVGVFVPLQIRLPQELALWLDETSLANRISRAAFIGEALRLYRGELEREVAKVEREERAELRKAQEEMVEL